MNFLPGGNLNQLETLLPWTIVVSLTRDTSRDPGRFQDQLIWGTGDPWKRMIRFYCDSLDCDEIMYDLPPVDSHLMSKLVLTFKGIVELKISAFVRRSKICGLDGSSKQVILDFYSFFVQI